MVISNSPAISNMAWESYKTSKEWTLQGRNGQKTIFVKFRDEAGNESKLLSANILLDNEPPITGTLLINNGRTLTKSSRVSLTMNARNADLMMISNTSDFKDAIWEEYSALKVWFLDNNEGLKTVFIKFKDKCGNESIVISKDITLVNE
jgi:hypothetical protein